MTYIPNTLDERDEMLAAIGVKTIDDLFADVPAEVRLASPPGPEALSEYDTLRLMAERAGQNRPAATSYLNFMGAGSYEHYIPAAGPALAQRGEFLTAYTPYQAEASQGTLQVVYEFQSLIGELTGLEAANASMYDGASALAEAALMAVRVTNKNQILIPESLHPAYEQVLRSYTQYLGLEILTWNPEADPAWPEGATDVAGAVIAQPNFWGYLCDAESVAALAHENGALAIAVVNPMSLSVIEAPGNWGADIAVGETQPMGLPMNFGGPYAGFMSTHPKHVRKMPGRIVGKTLDVDGNDAFVLTLQTREQHIRRERATSNICTNQGLCAAMVTFYLSLVGKRGFEEIGKVNLARAWKLKEALCSIDGVEVTSDAPIFNEFAIRLPVAAEDFCARMKAEGILAGLPAAKFKTESENVLIVCATETKSVTDIETYVETAKKVLSK